MKCYLFPWERKHLQQESRHQVSTVVPGKGSMSPTVWRDGPHSAPGTGRRLELPQLASGLHRNGAIWDGLDNGTPSKGMSQVFRTVVGMGLARAGLPLAAGVRGGDNSTCPPQGPWCWKLCLEESSGLRSAQKGSEGINAPTSLLASLGFLWH